MLALALIVLRVGIGSTDGWSWLTAWLGLSWLALLCSVGEMLICLCSALLCWWDAALFYSASCYLCSGGDWWGQKISKSPLHITEKRLLWDIFSQVYCSTTLSKLQNTKNIEYLIFMPTLEYCWITFLQKKQTIWKLMCSVWTPIYVFTAGIFHGRYEQDAHSPLQKKILKYFHPHPGIFQS